MKKDQLSSIDAWYAACINKQNSSISAAELCGDMITSLQTELPATLEATFERACNLQCEHCVYGPERSSRLISEKCKFPEILLNLVLQLPTKKDFPFFRRPVLIHGGRILRKWHLEILKLIRELRSDIEISLIDNGTYVNYLDEFVRLGFRFNWIDLSLDGLREAHNRQRDPQGKFRSELSPWDVVMNGFKYAREAIVPFKEGGTISALMTLTRLNFGDVEELAHLVFGENLADEMHYCPMSPERPVNFPIELTEEDLVLVWRALTRVFRLYGSKRVFFKLFQLDDFKKLERVVGSRALWKALNSKSIKTFVEGDVIFEIEGVVISFFPVSIWPHEAFLVDADGVNRAAHAQKFTLDELRRENGNPAIYNISALTPNENYLDAYQRTVNHWWKHFGAAHFMNELEYFAELQKRAGK
ncbi:MAG: hypothetical protein Q8P07_05630 [bacterium]|nr:hypothetical protein [bacterium]